MDLSGFRAALGDIPVEDHPTIVQQKSRDHYWYSPRLKAELENVTAQLVVSPRTQDEVVTTLRAAFKHDVPITPRGAGTGNYGQAMPLSGGAMLSLMNLDRIVSIKSDRGARRGRHRARKAGRSDHPRRQRRDALPPLDLSHGVAGRLHRRRLGRRRLDPLRGPARLRQRCSG